MADPSTVSLLPVVVGGALTITGGRIGGGITLIIKWIESGKEERKRRTEKFEQLVEAVYEFDHWVDTAKNIRVFQADGKIEVSPQAKIEAISAVYFPQFFKEIAALSSAVRVYEVWMSEAAQRRHEKRISEINDGFEPVFDAYIKQRNGLLESLKEFARKEFQ